MYFMPQSLFFALIQDNKKPDRWGDRPGFYRREGIVIKK